MTSTYASPVNELRIQTAADGTRALTFLEVNGVDLLDLQQATERPDGSPYPYGLMVFVPADPVGLLPPDSSVLLPTALPRQAMIGICSCGAPECASLWMQVRRDEFEDVVVWEPDPSAPSSSIDTTYRFDLLDYLDAIDDGHRSTTSWETRPRLLARELRRRQGGLFEFMGGRLLRVRTWPGVEYLSIRVATDDGPHEYQIPVPDDRTDEQLLDELEYFDAGRYRRTS